MTREKFWFIRLKRTLPLVNGFEIENALSFSLTKFPYFLEGMQI